MAGILFILLFLLGRVFENLIEDGLIQSPLPSSTAVLQPEPTLFPSETSLIAVTPTRVRTAVPLLPTQTPTVQIQQEDPQPTATKVFLTMTPDANRAACLPDSCIPRFGASGQIGVIAAAYEAGLPFGTYFNWELMVEPLQVGPAVYWQMIRVSETGIRDDWEEIDLAVENNPGAVWIIGNEPDIIWQDNTTAEQYAVVYHDVYDFIKERDPQAQIAVAGVGQPTPLRLMYLDTVLATYEQTYGQPMPVDIWTIHNFILREERGSWGVDIPPGMTQESGKPVEQGMLYEIVDHDDQTIFQQNLIAFRQWMADRGYRERPLAVTEFGILIPEDFGFPTPIVADFLTGTMNFLVRATDDTIGHPADNNRLVQWAFWYSVYDPLEFPTGNLYDPETGELTALGQIYTDYINGN